MSIKFNISRGSLLKYGLVECEMQKISRIEAYEILFYVIL